MHANGWQFWIDRGGTFTDIVALDPHGNNHQHKLLSENPTQYEDAALQGILDLLGLTALHQLQGVAIDAVKMGTTVATNALLERKGEATALLITQGFADALKIGYQHRADLFSLQIKRPAALYQQVAEVEERVAANGELVCPLNTKRVFAQLTALYQQGIRAVAIALMHAYRYPDHEQQIAAVAQQVGFTQISVSHQVSPLIKLIGRGDTTVVDAYLSPILRRYVDRIEKALGHCPLQFMQSSGGLTDAHSFQGKDAILSGPAGGVVGMVETARKAGFNQIIGFDMGGTSTDVSLFNGEYQRSFETEVAGVRMRAPMMKIHTVAAGGGSILAFDGARLTVGPASAGAYPGPACYRNGGPLTVTDINVLLGKIQPDFFPALFGKDGQQALDINQVKKDFQRLANQVSAAKDSASRPEQIASGMLRLAVNHMANAIKKISTQQGHDVGQFTLACFGGAGAQHACLVADQLGIRSVFVHRLSGVLSAYGMGLASVSHIQQQTIERPLDDFNQEALQALFHHQVEEAITALTRQHIAAADVSCRNSVNLRYQGSDTQIEIELADADSMTAAFRHKHQQQFGFTQDSPLIISGVQVEASAANRQHASQPSADDSPCSLTRTQPCAITTRSVFMDGIWQQVPFYERTGLSSGATLAGPAIILEPATTVVIEPGWQARVSNDDGLILERVVQLAKNEDIDTSASPDPIMLELFNSLFMHIAEQMGTTLQQTASSVNIKERLDFSCAVFDSHGDLVANAPHMPVHLGSMSESVRSVIAQNHGRLKPGDSIMLNSPYHGGTHLPDITVVTPLFNQRGDKIQFFVASRGHHADIGGTTPGSMPAESSHIEQEGILFENFKLVSQGVLASDALLTALSQGKYPARTPLQNLADLKAQLAANQRGIKELTRTLNHFGEPAVAAYMRHVQNYAEQCVRKAIGKLRNGAYQVEMDNGAVISVAITVDQKLGQAVLDFSGSSEQQPGNFNAPTAITKAVVLYVFRSLVDAPIPLNVGCLKPLKIILPERSVLSPRWPAAVVAGNVETSQCITDAILGALGVQAESQGTMNNLTFGNSEFQYYETLCGGSGAGLSFSGTDAIHSHMTNSRLTDPEILESRYPVRLEAFSIRQNSGGNGIYRGGNGATRKLCFLQPMTLSLLGNHRRVAPKGLNGGEEGAIGRNELITNSGNHRSLPGCCQLQVNQGDTLIIHTPGGGGSGKASSASQTKSRK
ncbi:5-oxoprolinase [Corallincola luteus]|uniref:5-oxoprolinase n=1 Tax=Corallincola luteus TaxID=1775177 RepID=A0ABY2AMM9_9GAMM|nr:hydantoinase B/oxoprolinase family protein [Corallincola luteus]TCI04459.1 5-oxoprolinase [Corallincola luteus]